MTLFLLMSTMQSQLSALLLGDSAPNVAYILAGLVAAVVVVSKLSRDRKFDHIPTVGWSIWPGPWMVNGTKLIQEGCGKYKSAPFKIADRFSWIVVLSNREHLEEVRKAPEDVISFHDAIAYELKSEYTMTPDDDPNNPYQNEVIRSRLNRNLANIYDEMRDEIRVSFEEVLDLKDHEWKSISPLTAMQQVVCRTSNRVFVGLPLCRNSDWLDLNLGYTLDIVFGALLLKFFPDFLAPLIMKFMTRIPASIKRGVKLLSPIIEERLRLLEEHGKDWADKPNDMLSWLLDAAPEGPERSVKLWTIRLLTTNFAAIHSFTHVLFYLVGHPQYIEPLREEVESVVEREGWSKASLGKMRKIDSFLKECQRFAGIATTGLLRKVVKDHTFSDGTFIPKGMMVVAPTRELHRNSELYGNANEFNPFRFSDMHEEDGEGAKYQFTSTSREYLPFGHGRHACPGRFFASTELKTMLAHILMSYDIKLEDNKTQPKEIILGVNVIPDTTAKIMFRRRI